MKKIVFNLALLCTIFTLVGLGMLPTLLTYQATPPGRVFTGMWSRSDDFFGFTSMIKSGMAGRNTMVLRSLPDNQKPSTHHLTYVWAGKVAGLLPFSAPEVFHLMRALYGAVFILVSFRLFFLLFQNRSIALATTIIAFTQGPIGSSFGNTDFIDTVSSRATTRPHYVLGAILFILVFSILIRKTRADKKLAAFCILLSTFLVIAHISSAVVLLIICGVYTLWQIKTGGLSQWKTLFKTPVIFTIAGLGIGFALNQWSMGQLPQFDFYPAIPPAQKALGMFSPKALAFIDFSKIPKDLVSFGPALWLSVPGFLLGLKKGQGKFMLIWLIVQLSCYFFLYPLFLVEPVRFVQTLYFIPMAYGTSLFLLTIGKQIHRLFFPLAIIVLVVLFLPGYLTTLKRSINDFTDFKSFSLFAFPTIAQRQAYAFLDENTPKESRVIANYEAANHIMMYSHNFVLGNPHMWTGEDAEKMVRGRNIFFSGVLPEKEAKNYLQSEGVSYVYYGYQERVGDIAKYSFLTPVYKNNDVIIFKVY